MLIFKRNFDGLKSELLQGIREEMASINSIRGGMLPDRIYENVEDALREEQKLVYSKSKMIRFMSVSAINILSKTLASISGENQKTILLLLLSPKQKQLLKKRCEQLHEYEGEAAEKLRGEIIRSICKAYEIRSEYPGKRMNILIRFHREIPLSRIELANGVLYLSYYLSQKSQSDKGPVMMYSEDSRVYDIYHTYFNDMWESAEDEIDLARYNHISDLERHIDYLFNDAGQK